MDAGFGDTRREDSAAGAVGGEHALKRVLIVDDHPLVRQGIAALISQQPDMEVCGEASSAAEALTILHRCRADVALVDLKLKDSSGLELIKDIMIRFPHVPVLVLSMRDEGFYAERVLRAGARGYLTKDEGPLKVVEGLRKVLAGQIHVSEKVATRLMGKLLGEGDRMSRSPIETLTDRELEVFEHIGGGMATREIASRLHISAKTVDSHREHIKRKLQIDTAAELTRQAIQWVQYQQNTG